MFEILGVAALALAWLSHGLAPVGALLAALLASVLVLLLLSRDMP